ncbi:hypothetical protein GGF46_000368 [Coemansia sp. RSA 552]|nr:hypothetical protein GGF46_000368 [Coemansia sp. RSA 552]
MSLTKVRRTMFDVERRFNERFHYPYVFLSETPFPSEFQKAVRHMAPQSQIRFGLVEDWVPENTSLSGYQAMSRYWAYPFVRHPELHGFRYIWRLEPGAHYPCDIVEDPLDSLGRHNLTYAFGVSVQEPGREGSARAWRTALEFSHRYPHLVENNTLGWLVGARGFNYCQVLTNFEVVDLDFLRSPAYQHLFEFFDSQRGFFTEGSDATIRSLAISLLLPPQKVRWLSSVGYIHDSLSNCPSGDIQRLCHCNPAKSSHLLPTSCAAQWAHSSHMDPRKLH